MAKALATLCVLLSCLWPTVQDDPHILSCNFTVEARSKLTESLPQCSVDGVPFHLNDNDNKRKEKCAGLFSKLKDIKEDLWGQLPTLELLGNLTSGNHSLLVTVVSQYKEGQRTYGYWNFTLDGQHFFGFNCFDSKNKKCAPSPNNTRGIDKWQNNNSLVRHLETFIGGDSGYCFPKILSQSKEIAGSMSRTPDIGIVTSPSQLPFTMNTTQLPFTMNTTQLPSTKQPLSKEGSSITEVVIPIVIGILILIGVLAVIICIRKCVKRKSHTQGGKMCYIFGNRRGQRTPSAVGEPCPEESICMTVMSPLEGDSPRRSSASSVI